MGLGNPTDEYLGTRHNLGREIVARWQKTSGAADFTYDKKWNALVSKNKKNMLLLPETFMNKSGNAVGPATRFFKVKSKDIVIMHDDADILLGCTKLSFGKHSAGHKGVESVKRALGTWNFWRLRVGIQRKKRVEAEKLVLQKLKPDEQKIIKKLEKKIFEGLELFAAKEENKAVNVINCS